MSKEHFGHHFIATGEPDRPDWLTGKAYRQLLNADCAVKSVVGLSPGHAAFIETRLRDTDIYQPHYHLEITQERTPFLMASVVESIHVLAEMKGRDWVMDQIYNPQSSNGPSPLLIDEVGYLTDSMEMAGQDLWRRNASPGFKIRITEDEIKSTIGLMKDLEKQYAAYVFNVGYEGKNQTEALDIIRRVLYFGWRPRDDIHLEIFRLMEIGPTYRGAADEAQFLKEQGLGDGQFNYKKYIESLKNSMDDDFKHFTGHTWLTRLISGNLKHINQRRTSVHADDIRDDFWDERLVAERDVDGLVRETEARLLTHSVETDVEQNNEYIEHLDGLPSFKKTEPHVRADMQRVARRYHTESIVEIAQLLGGAYLVVALFNLGLLDSDMIKTVEDLKRNTNLTDKQYYHILSECIRHMDGWTYTGPPGLRRGKATVTDLPNLRNEALSFIDHAWKVRLNIYSESTPAD